MLASLGLMSTCSNHEHDKEFKAAVGKLQAGGFKLTRPRQALLKAIVRQHGPFSAEDIFKAMQRSARGKKFDLVTVYRGLATLESLTLLARCDFGDGVIRYEWQPQDGHHHHHLICTGCRKIQALSFCVVQGQEKILSKTGFTNISHKLEFFGLCPACAG